MISSIMLSLAVHPHGRGEEVDDMLSAAKKSRFTPTGVGRKAEVGHPLFDRRGSPPRAWGGRT